MIDLQVFDSRHVWHEHIIAAAKRIGWSAKRIEGEFGFSRYGFIRPHPAFMPLHRNIDANARMHVTMIQDRAQVEVYEDKTEQFRRWGKFLPDTWVFTSKDEAMAWSGDFPVVSKANEGASSVNVRIIESQRELHQHIKQAFSPTGIPVNRCADGHMTAQQGYVFLQRCIPHDRTYRVNIVGERMAIFERFNYPNRMVAQTGNTDGITRWTELHESLFEYAAMIGQAIGSKFVALDILRDGDEWRLIETSLAWPWTPVDYSDVPFTGGGLWVNMWDVLLEQVAAGVFDSSSP